MRYKLIVFDLDETIWTTLPRSIGVSNGPFELAGEDEARSTSATIRLFPGVRRLLRNLCRRHKHISLASRSDAAVCDDLLRLFGIHQYFSYPQYGWQEKSQAVINILKSLADREKEHIEPRDVLFIDDWPSNVEAVRSTGAATLLFGRDVRSILELANILD
ncbi:MAG: magnesium-dependent phosphatase-1 [Planctomycetes bacterium]|nr:magnesium-dependent phosphatase-1 [Planctomycetota bacterium]